MPAIIFYNYTYIFAHEKEECICSYGLCKYYILSLHKSVKNESSITFCANVLYFFSKEHEKCTRNWCLACANIFYFFGQYCEESICVEALEGELIGNVMEFSTVTSYLHQNKKYCFQI